LSNQYETGKTDEKMKKVAEAENDFMEQKFTNS
jgi:hypothetical protein